VIVSDLRMPAIDGLSFLCLASSLQPLSVRMILTGSAGFATAQRAINESGVFRCLTKPWDDTLLAAHIEAALVQTAAMRALDTRTPQQRERQPLEVLEPGITQVEWGPGGEAALGMPGATTAACPSRSRTRSSPAW
jgi:response regulator RpfG family c-di-GMP phosphodiesterase